MKKRLLFLLLIGFVLSGCSSAKEGEPTKVSGNNIKVINVKADGEHIIIEESGGEDILVAHNGKKKLNIKNDGNQLNIKPQKSSSIFNFKSKTIRLTIPKSFAGQLSVKSLAGEITAQQISTKTFYASTDSGNIKIDHLYGNAVKESSIDSVSGNIDVNLDPHDDGYAIDAKTKSGKLISKLKLEKTEGEQTKKTLKGYTGKQEQGASDVLIESATGKITINE